MSGAHPTARPLYCPFPAATHPDVASIEDGVIDWLWQYGFITSAEDEASARRVKFGGLAAMTFPHGDPHRLQVAADFMTWVFMFDDRYVERAVLEGSPFIVAQKSLASMRVINDPDDDQADPEPDMRALANVVRRLRAIVSPEQLDRVIAGVMEYLLAIGSEVILRITNTSPTLADYMRIRESTMMMRSFCFVFIEVVGEFELPTRVWFRPDVQRMARLASLVIAGTQDFYSGRRELAWAGAVNLPLLLARTQDVSWDAALDQTAEYIRRETEAFLLAAEPLRADPLLERYIVGVEHWIGGHLKWTLTTGRYHLDLAVQNEDAPGRFGE